MIALIKKDFRVDLAPVIGSIALVLMPYVVVLISYAMDRPEVRARAGELNDLFVAAGSAGLWMTGLVASAFGGAAFAQERRERSADFLAMLPVTRGKIVASKVIVSLGWPALVWLANLLVMWIASSIAPGAEMSRVSLQDGLWRAVGASATTGLMMFGVAWMFSSFLKSPTIAAVISMGMTVSLLMVLALISQRSGRNGREDEQWLDWLVMLSTFCFGILGLALGSVYYLARIEP